MASCSILARDESATWDSAPPREVTRRSLVVRMPKLSEATTAGSSLSTMALAYKSSKEKEGQEPSRGAIGGTHTHALGFIGGRGIILERGVWEWDSTINLLG